MNGGWDADVRRPRAQPVASGAILAGLHSPKSRAEARRYRNWEALYEQGGGLTWGHGLLVRVDLTRVRFWLWTTAVAVVVLDALAGLGETVHAPYVLTRFFDGDDKTNVPTSYKLFCLLAVAALFGAHAHLARIERHPFRYGWRLLTAVTGFALIDEAIYLHQSLSDVLRNRLHTHGVFTFAWTIVYLPAVVAVGLVLLRHLRFLPAPQRWPLLAGGGIYAIGAVAFEPVKSAVASAAGDSSLGFRLTALVSDSLEMIGLTILVVVLINQLAAWTRTLSVTLHQ